MLERIFTVSKPIIAMVHLQYDNGYSLQRMLKEVLEDVEKLERGGADGLLFENWGGDYANRHIDRQMKKSMTALIKEASKRTKLPYGINILPLDYEAAFDISQGNGAKFVQIDTFVDTARTDYKSEFILRVEPQEIIAYKRKLGLDYLALFANIQTKHYKTVPSNKIIETSALQAIREGANALVVTGEKTGMKTPLEKLTKVKSVSNDVPVLVGSGLNAKNAGELMPYADGAIVGSGLKYDGVVENPVDEERVKELMRVVHNIRDDQTHTVE